MNTIIIINIIYICVCVCTRNNIRGIISGD